MVFKNGRHSKSSNFLPQKCNVNTINDIYNQKYNDKHELNLISEKHE